MKHLPLKLQVIFTSCQITTHAKNDIQKFYMTLSSQIRLNVMSNFYLRDLFAKYKESLLVNVSHKYRRDN